jgi:biphenyl 2,3-dioxygenase beta subunit
MKGLVALNFDELQSPTDAQLRAANKFMLREARLLDERLFDSWFDTLHDDLEYVVFNRFTPDLRTAPTPASLIKEFRAQGELQFTEETKDSMRYRIDRLKSGLTFAETPPGRTIRLVSNIDIARIDQRLVVQSCLHCNRTRKEGRVENYFARRQDILAWNDDTLLLAQRHVLLNETVLDSPAVNIFF